VTHGAWAAIWYSTAVRAALGFSCVLLAAAVVSARAKLQDSAKLRRLITLGAALCMFIWAWALIDLFDILHVWYLARRYNLVTALVTGLLIATCPFVGGTFLFRHVWTGRSRIRHFALRAGTGVCATLYGVTVAELLLYCFFAESHGTGATIAARRWFDRHWKPINSLGYRDGEHPQAELRGRKLLCVVGDSFTAGHGIKNAEERFSNILQDKLDDEWVVANVAKGAWDTGAEYDALISYPQTPDAVVLAYFINDIAGAADRNGTSSPAPSGPSPPSILRSWVEGYYVFNLAHSRLAVQREARSSYFNAYWHYMYQSYSQGDVWKSHSDELLDVIRYCASRRIELTVLVIPQLRDVARSRPITSRVAEFIRSQGVRVVDLTAELIDKEPAELVVNRFDAHANENLHRLIAERLFDAITTARCAEGIRK